MVNWTEINPNFTPEIQQQWESYGFNQEEVRQWLSIGLQIYEADLADCLKQEGYVSDRPFAEGVLESLRLRYSEVFFAQLTNHTNQGIIPEDNYTDPFLLTLPTIPITTSQLPITSLINNQEEIKKDWTDIHPDFGNKDYFGKTHQQEWKEKGFTYQEAKEWIAIGFETNEYNVAKNWKNQGFTAQQTQEWINAGLKKRGGYGEKEEAEFAKYCQQKDYIPQQAKDNLEKLRNEFHQTQTYFDWKYPLEKRNSVTKLDISNKNLTGSLKLVGFNNLTKFDCSDNKLTKLDVSGCLALTELNFSSNYELKELNVSGCLALTELNCSYKQLTKLDVSGCLSLKELDCSNNKLTGDLTIFSQLLNCKTLDLKNNSFTDSLAPLQQLTELKKLDIKNTKLTIGLAYLPESLAEFYCQGTKFEEGLRPYKKSTGYSNNNYFSLFQLWKKDCFPWKDQGFTDQEVNQWISAGLLFIEYDFVNYLKQKKKLTPAEIGNNLPKLRADFYQPDVNDEKLNTRVAKTIKLFELNFGRSQNNKLTYEQKSLLEQLILNQTLWERYEKYGLCFYCQQPNVRGNDKVRKYWCQDCGLTGNHAVDEFIQQQQLTADKGVRILELIPYEQFSNIEHLANGGFGTVYKAKWQEKKQIVLKSLHNSQNITKDFLQEIANHKKVDKNNLIVKCSGITQDPKTKNYLMVMDYIKGGSLRQFLNKNFHQLNFKSKLEQLVRISNGLKSIHKLDLVHRDFHAGNILNKKQSNSIFCYITDFGLCRPADETSEEKIFGVLPYVAPEVLQSQPYTQASDIYSFGIIAYEIISGLPPYYDQVHNVKLGIEICQGLRPQFQIKVPQLLEDLIKKCWDTDPSKRLTANELKKTLRTWQAEINDYHKNTEFKNQLQEAEKFNQTLPDKIKFPNYKIHQGAVYHSKLLPTGEITQLMQNLNFQTKTLELNEHLTQGKQLAKEITMEQKYNDFKKVLKLVLEKSGELEEIITTNQIVISEEMKEVLTKIKELKIKSQKKDNVYQELVKKKLAKENELKELKKNIVTYNKIKKRTHLSQITDLLEKQEALVKNNDEESVKRLEDTKELILELEIINEAEINQLCQLQTEITQLELKLNQNIDQSTKQLTQIINKIEIGGINFTNTQVVGSVVMGVGQVGNNVNLSTKNITYQAKRPREDDWEESLATRNKTEQLDLMEIEDSQFQVQIPSNQNWTNLHPNFTPTLINQWKTNNFTYEQTQEWINIGLTSNDSNFCAWLRDTKHLTAEECLNYHDLNQLKNEYQAQLLQAQIQIPPKN